MGQRGTRLESEKQNGNRNAIIALGLLEQPERFLSTMQVGMTGIAIISGYYGEAALGEKFSHFLAQFPAVEPRIWMIVAHQLFNETEGKPARGYDPAIGRGFSIFDGPPPALWPQFGTLKRVPLLILRAEKSDLLTADTVRQMEARHPRAGSYVVRGQSHAPLLMDDPTVDRIKAFLAETDGEGAG